MQIGFLLVLHPCTQTSKVKVSLLHGTKNLKITTWRLYLFETLEELKLALLRTSLRFAVSYELVILNGSHLPALNKSI